MFEIMKVIRNTRVFFIMVFVTLIAFTGYFKWSKELNIMERNIIVNQPKAIIFRWTPLHWEQWNGFCDGKVNYAETTLKTPIGRIPIFIHDVTLDSWVSKSIKRKGAWEKGLLKLVHHFLSEDGNLNFIDIGSHIGQYSLLAAAMGRQVVSVDPLYENVHRLCKSIETNEFNHLIKVFYTAVSDTRTKAMFQFSEHNIGGTNIKKTDEVLTRNENFTQGFKVVSPPVLSSSEKNVTNTVLLDDMLPLIPFKRAFIKMDVESHENYVLKGGEMFFSLMDIRYVLMEWIFHQHNPISGNQIQEFMTRHGFLPSMPTRKRELFVGNKVPENILWVKV